MVFLKGEDQNCFQFFYLDLIGNKEQPLEMSIFVRTTLLFLCMALKPVVTVNILLEY